MGKMPEPLRRFCSGIPPRFLAVLLVALAYVVFLTVDQMHWWQLRPDYAFGWLVPVFVVYVVVERWPMLRAVLGAAGSSPLARWQRDAVAAAAGLALAMGLVLFLMGAVY